MIIVNTVFNSFKIKKRVSNESTIYNLLKLFTIHLSISINLIKLMVWTFSVIEHLNNISINFITVLYFDITLTSKEMSYTSYMALHMYLKYYGIL